MPEDFHGVLPALITPFSEDGDAIDTRSLAAIVDRLIDAGVAGLVPGGSTGEFTALTHPERRELLEATVEAAGGRVPVVAGTGALTTRETIELSVHAQQAGAAAVMIVPPFYDPLSWPELLAHYVAVAATELIQTGGPTLLNGWDTLTFAALAAGVRAVVWGVASVAPKECVELHRLLIDDVDLPAARELWSRLWPLCQFLESQSYPAAVKAACRLAGDTTGPVRAPLLPLDEDATAELAVLLDHATLAGIRPARRWKRSAARSGRG